MVRANKFEQSASQDGSRSISTPEVGSALTPFSVICEMHDKEWVKLELKAYLIVHQTQ